MTTMAPMTTMSCYIGLRSVDGFADESLYRRTFNTDTRDWFESRCSY